MSVILRLLFRIKLDKRIDPHDADARLHRTLKLPHLADAGLQHAKLQLVHDLTSDEIKAVVLVALLARNRLLVLVPVALLDALRQGVARPQLRHQLGRVLGRVDGQRLGHDEEGLRELADRQLLAGADRPGELLEVDVEGRLDGAAAGDDAAALERSKRSSPLRSDKVLRSVPPVALAIRRRSSFLHLLTPMAPFSTNILRTKSSIPFVVRMTLAPARKMSSTLSSTMPDSRARICSNCCGSSTVIWTPIFIRSFCRFMSRMAILASWMRVGMACEATVQLSA
ncbi:hypothetical protein CP532_0101 [Ophiocordyceps camponoti-leonardi (nom. inval.)]|nr:hypothetical protein CP532_0101 [Ophiocordyceps camponoti-leonardi (nom. inval.)]